MSADALLLVEYELSEKVEDRVFGTLKTYGAIFGIALALVGFMGFGFLLDSISRRTEKEVRDSIDKDLQELRSRAQATLIDLQVALGESKMLSQKLGEEIQFLREKHTELESLDIRYKQLHEQVNGVSQQVASAVESAATSLKVNASTRGGFGQSARKPSVRETSFDWLRVGTLKGRNFGMVPGRVTIRINGSFDGEEMISASEMQPIEARPEDFVLWTDEQAIFNLPPEIGRKVDEFKQKTIADWDRVDPRKLKRRSLHYSFELIRVDGEAVRQ